jgi:hypothetical protein
LPVGSVVEKEKTPPDNVSRSDLSSAVSGVTGDSSVSGATSVVSKVEGAGEDKPPGNVVYVSSLQYSTMQYEIYSIKLLIFITLMRKFSFIFVNLVIASPDFY